jgi:hypothetical protein
VKTDNDFKRPFSRLRLATLAGLGVLALAAGGAAETLGASSGGFGPGSGGTGTGGGGGDQGTTNEEPAKFARFWDQRLRPAEKRWAHRTADCESGHDPNAIGAGGRYRGAFQFMRSTWKRSPKSPGGDPIDYSYRTQAVVAVLLKRRDGAGHWPVCG